MKSIEEVSNALYSDLKKNRGVVGSGVKIQNNARFIIIYVTKATKEILGKIPSSFMGFKVKPEVTKDFFEFNV